MRFAVARELARDAAETLERVERHAIETVERAQGIDAVLRVAGVVDEVERLVPLPPLRGEHDSVNGGHDFRERRRAAPMAGRAAVDGVDIHERDGCAAGARVGERDVRAGGVTDHRRKFRCGGRRGREFGFKFEWRKSGHFEGFHYRGISSHKFRC